MRRAVAGLVLAVLLSACAPYPGAPLGHWDSDLCDRVRAWVADGSLPVLHAERWYRKCGPFDPPQDGGADE